MWDFLVTCNMGLNKTSKFPASGVYCHGLNVCVPPNSYAEILMLKVMMFGGVVFGRWLVVRVEPHDGISVFMKETPQCSLTASAMWGHSEK